MLQCHLPGGMCTRQAEQGPAQACVWVVCFYARKVHVECAPLMCADAELDGPIGLRGAGAALAHPEPQNLHQGPSKTQTRAGGHLGHVSVLGRLGFFVL